MHTYTVLENRPKKLMFEFFEMSSKVITFFHKLPMVFLGLDVRVKNLRGECWGGGNALAAGLGSWLSIKTASRIICEEIDPTIVVGNGIHGNFV